MSKDKDQAAAAKPEDASTAVSTAKSVIDELRKDAADKPDTHPFDHIFKGETKEELQAKEKPAKAVDDKAAIEVADDDDEAISEHDDDSTADHEADDANEIDDSAEWTHAEELARAAGIPDNIIQEYESPQELRGAVRMLQRLAAARKAQDGNTSEEKTNKRRFDKKLDPDKYDADLVAYIDEMNEHYAKQVEEIDAIRDEYSRREQERIVEANQRAMSEAVDKLPENVQALFGFGAEPDARTVKQVRNLERLAEEAERIEAGYRARGDRVPSVEAILNKALRSEFADEIKTNDTALSKKLADRAGSIIPRANGRNRGSFAGEDGDARLDEIIGKLRVGKG